MDVWKEGASVATTWSSRVERNKTIMKMVFLPSKFQNGHILLIKSSDSDVSRKHLISFPLSQKFCSRSKAIYLTLRI